MPGTHRSGTVDLGVGMGGLQLGRSAEPDQSQPFGHDLSSLRIHPVPSGRSDHNSALSGGLAPTAHTRPPRGPHVPCGFATSASFTLTRFLGAETLARWAGGALARTLAVRGDRSRAAA